MEKFRQTLKVKKERAILVAALLSRSKGSDGLAELTALATLGGIPMTDELSLAPTHPTPVSTAPLPAPGNQVPLEVRSEGTGSFHLRVGVRYAPLVTPETPAEERGFLQVFVAFIEASAEVVLNYEHDDFQWLSANGVKSLIPVQTHRSIDAIEELILSAMGAPPEAKEVKR